MRTMYQRDLLYRQLNGKNLSDLQEDQKIVINVKNK